MFFRCLQNMLIELILEIFICTSISSYTTAIRWKGLKLLLCTYIIYHLLLFITDLSTHTRKSVGWFSTFTKMVAYLILCQVYALKLNGTVCQFMGFFKTKLKKMYMYRGRY